MATQLERIMSVLKHGPVTAAQLAEKAGLPIPQTSVSLNIAMKRGLLDRLPLGFRPPGYKKIPYVYRLKNAQN